MADGIFSQDSSAFLLTPGDLHLWYGDLDDHRYASLTAFLSSDEHLRAARYLDPHVGRRFGVGRGLLRAILGRYLQQAPEMIIFEGGAQGKPRLGGASADSTFLFNLSHSGGMILVGVIQGRQIGVDIEFVRPIDQPIKLAQRFFSPAEAMNLAALPETDQQTAFFRCWTFKEAFIKARGGGMSIPLDSFEVTFAKGKPPVLQRCADDDPQRWRLIEVESIPGYVGAAVVELPLGVVHIRAL